MSYSILHREIARRSFHLVNLFDQLRETRVDRMPHGCKTREEAFKSMWQHC